jgi:hypothetical protein
VVRSLAIALVCVGCSTGGPVEHSGFIPPECGQNGVVSLAITIRGQAPSPTTCAGLDHLVVTLHGCYDVDISPVPCIDKFRYDHLPEGAVTVEVDGFDANGFTRVSGIVDDDLATTPPDTPTPINLQ